MRAQADDSNPFNLSEVAVDTPIVADQPVVHEERAERAEAVGSEEVVEVDAGMELDVAEIAKVDCTVPLTDASGESPDLPISVRKSASCASPAEMSVLVGGGGSGIDREGEGHNPCIRRGALVRRSDESKADPAVEAATGPDCARTFDGGRACSRDCSSTRPVSVDACSSGSARDGSSGGDGGGDSDGGLGELERILNLLHKDYVREQEVEILQLIGQLGGDSSKYVRERKRAMKHIVSEIYFHRLVSRRRPSCYLSCVAFLDLR